MITTLDQVAPDLNYRPPTGSYDEMLDAQGHLRPGWSPFLEALQRIGKPGLEHRREQVRRLIRENGVTFNVYGAADGTDRPWLLDPFPMIIEGGEWKVIEAGLRQRAQLLTALLEDVYGSQRCLKEGWLPSELVYGHPGYLRPCHGLPIPPECRLLLHAVDLARTAQGELCVLRDRAEAPAGCGYALENRLAVARMMPEFLRSTQVQKLAPFFRSVRNTLSEVAERAFNTPRVVFLTPGPANETFFEHAYLAQYLGYSLVQGDDLTVRDNRVYLKLLEGLQPVDVILRRLRDNYSDPLELRSDSVIGIPGLVQAVRAGNVVVANCLGSGWLETPALHAYLPTLCRKFLGGDLAIPGAPTWWCGDPDSLRYVLDNLDIMVIKPTFALKLGSSIFVSGLEPEARNALKGKILQNPSAYVGQRQLQLSTAPTLQEDRLEPRRVVLRTFITRELDDFVVMPGALTLVAQAEASKLATLQKGAGSKDTWIVASATSGASTHGTPPARAFIELSRGGGDIPSRSADNLFWLGRYLERSEGLVRLLRCCIFRLDEENRPGSAREAPLLLALSDEPRFHRGKVDRSDSRSRILDLMSDAKNYNGLRQNMENVQRLSGTVRDRISEECWRLLNHLFELSKSTSTVLRDAQSVLDEMVMGFSSFSGLIAENMSRSHSWRFLEMGRRIERATTMVALIRRSLSSKTPYEDAILEALLEISDATRTYRRRYPAGLQIAPVLDLLLADESNPRSVAFQLNLLDFHFHHLPGRSMMSLPNPEEKLLMSCLSRVKLADIFKLAATNETRRRSQLHHLLRGLAKDIPLLSDLLVRKYLTHLTIKSQSPGFGREALP